MLKEKMLQKINANPVEVAKVLNNMSKYGKTYAIISNGFYIETFRKTKKGAEKFCERPVHQWYDEYEQKMTENYVEFIEITREDLADWANDTRLWYEFLRENPVHEYYTDKKYFLKNYVEALQVSENVLEYISREYDRMLNGFPPKAPEATEAAHTDQEAADDKLIQEPANEEPAAENPCQTARIVFNSELNGIEIYYHEKPDKAEIAELKAAKWRWNRNKKCWYKKDTEVARKFISRFTSDFSHNPSEPAYDNNIKNETEADNEMRIHGKYTMIQKLGYERKIKASHVEIEGAFESKYAQYGKSLLMKYRPAGGRKWKHVRFVDTPTLFVPGYVKTDQAWDSYQEAAVAEFTSGYEGLKFFKKD